MTLLYIYLWGVLVVGILLVGSLLEDGKNFGKDKGWIIAFVAFIGSWFTLIAVAGIFTWEHYELSSKGWSWLKPSNLFSKFAKLTRYHIDLRYLLTPIAIRIIKVDVGTAVSSIWVIKMVYIFGIRVARYEVAL